MSVFYYPTHLLMGLEIEPATLLFACVANAFADLSEQGYFARSNWGFSISDGLDQVPDNRQDRYVFFHAQDTDAAIETGDLYLAWAGDPIVIGDALRRNGLTVVHDGSQEVRIEVRLAEEI